MTLRWHGAEEFSGDFFSLRFFGVGPWARHPWGHRRVLTDAPRTPTAPTQGCKGHGLEAWRWGKHPAKETRLLTRHLEEVWFPGHACHALVASLFASLFAGKREVPPLGGGGRPQHTSEQPQHTSECHPRCSLRFIWGAREPDGSAPKTKRSEIASKRPKT